MLKFLDFWAPWCGPCKIMDPIIDELEKEYQGKFEVERINVDEKGDVANQYGVMSIPTYIVEKDGKEVWRRVGVTPKAELVKAVTS